MPCQLKYLELKTGQSDCGPAWIARVNMSRSGRTIYFNGRALRRNNGRGFLGNYFDADTREEYWVSGVKKNGEDRYPWGRGVILVERDAVDEYLGVIGASTLAPKRFRVTDEIVATDPSKFSAFFNEPL